MKTELLKLMNLEKKLPNGVALLFCVCLTLLFFTPAASQVRENKQITAIQLRGAAEGSRVTVVSDAPLIDYKAFRRGDRFYVKISLADLTAPAPRFRADGFEDIQVQKVGDSQILSFKLQPGATARVDQRGNHLDVVFSAANRIPLLNSENPSGDRGPDTAGPMPSDSAAARVRTVTGRDGSTGSSATTRQAYLKTNSNKAENNQLTTANVVASAAPSPSPSSSPSSNLSAGTSTSYQPLSATTPIAQSSPSPANSSSGSGNPMAAVSLWLSANRLATLLGVLIPLGLIVYLVFVARRRQDTVNKTRQAKRPTIVSSVTGHDE